MGSPPKTFSELFLLSGYNYKYINTCREKEFSHVPLFPIGQTINYNYINNILENYFLLPGYNYNYKNYSDAHYLCNNFVDHGGDIAFPYRTPSS